MPHIRVFSPGHVTNLTLSDYHRTEATRATDNILVEKGAKVDYLSINNASLFNQCEENITFINNRGTIGVLHLEKAYPPLMEKKGLFLKLLTK